MVHAKIKMLPEEFIPCAKKTVLRSSLVTFCGALALHLLAVFGGWMFFGHFAGVEKIIGSVLSKPVSLFRKKNPAGYRAKKSNTVSVRCAIMLISVLVACLPFSACAQCYWGEIELKKAESPRTVNTLYSWKYEPENIITERNKITKAAIREDKLLVYFSAIGNDHPFINVYDLNGCYLYGYSMKFDAQSGGTHLLHMYNGDPLLYSGISKCIYQFSVTEAIVYDAPYVETVRQADDRNSQTTSIGECTDSKLTLVDEDGNEITVIDYTAEHAEIYPNTPLTQFGRLVSLFAFIAFCIFAISKFSDD